MAGGELLNPPTAPTLNRNVLSTYLNSPLAQASVRRCNIQQWEAPHGMAPVCTTDHGVYRLITILESQGG